MSNFTEPVVSLNSIEMVSQTVSNSIGNVNLEAYQPRRMVLEGWPFHDESIRYTAVMRDLSPGPAVINHLAENDVRDFNDIAAAGMRISQENYDTTVAQDVHRLQEANTWDAWRAQNYRDGHDAQVTIDSTQNDANNARAMEFATLNTADYTYQNGGANVRAWDDFTGSIYNVRV